MNILNINIKDYWKTVLYASSGWIILTAYLIYDYVNYGQFITAHLLRPHHLYETFFHILMLCVPFISTASGYLEYKKTLFMKVLEFAVTKMEEERSKAESIIAGIGDGISIQDTSYRVLYQNRIHKDFIGSHIGEYCYQGYENRDSICEGCPVALTFLDGKIHTVERSLASARGTRYFETTTSPLKNSKGEIIAGIEVVRNVSERKKTEEALKQSEEKYRALIDNIQDGVFIIHDAKMQFVNDAFAGMVGYTVDEVIGMPFQQLVAPEDLEIVRDRYYQRQAGKNIPREYEFRMLHRDGTTRVFVNMNVGLINFQGRVASMGTVKNITERKKAETELQKAQKLESLGILAGGIAHDFNNILTAILGNISLARMQAKPDDNLHKWLEEAEKASARAKDLTQQLLTFSKGGAPVKRVIFLEQVIKDSTGFALRGANVRCDLGIGEGLRPVEADEGQIVQAFNNLIINACEAMPNGGTITIGAVNVVIEAKDNLPIRDGEYVKITLADQGMGIPPEHLLRIFDPYFTTKQTGSGLGLAVTYSIIKNHEGHIDVKSTLGGGTVFTVYLPASEKQVDKKRSKAEKGTPGEGKILLMDDDEMVGTVGGEILHALGYTVELAGGGAETIEAYTRAKESGQPFDAVILDITIPGGMGGKETIKRLLEIDPGVKAIVSSGYSTDPIMANFKEFGFSEVIAKPYRSIELGKIVHKVITGK